MILLVMWDQIQLGLALSGVSNLAEKVGDVDSDQSLDRLPDRVNALYYEWIWRPSEEGARKYAHSAIQIQEIHYLLISILVVALTVLIEAGGMLAITGVAIAGYELAGISFDVVSLFRATVAFATLIAVSMMIHTQGRINRAYEHC